jgi:hypothetical protein
VIAEGIARVGQQGATWLQADVAREIAILLPADATGSGQRLVELVDELAAEAPGGASDCTHRPAEPWPAGSTAGPSASTSPTGA